MKTADEHQVPLSEAALAILQEMRPFRDPSNFLFPSARAGRPLGANALNKLMRKLELAAVPHGFRATFRTWAEERAGVRIDVAETALAHRVGSAVERAYSRSTRLEARRRLMDAWAAFVTGQTANVVDMRA